MNQDILSILFFVLYYILSFTIFHYSYIILEQGLVYLTF